MQKIIARLERLKKQAQYLKKALEKKQAPKAAPDKKEKSGKEAMKEMMRKMMKRMSPALKLRHAVLMKGRLGRHDPQALLALKDKLGLSDGQVEKLQVIAGTARAGAREVLTDAQAKKLRKLKGTPASMMGLHKRMMKKTAGAEGKKKEARERKSRMKK